MLDSKANRESYSTDNRLAEDPEPLEGKETIQKEKENIERKPGWYSSDHYTPLYNITKESLKKKHRCYIPFFHEFPSLVER